MRARMEPELVPEGLRTEHLVIDHGCVSIFVGPVEGFVNKLKLVKRQGYGWAGFDVLRARVLAA